MTWSLLLPTWRPAIPLLNSALHQVVVSHVSTTSFPFTVQRSSWEKESAMLISVNIP
jgi:hypothetical protein